MKILITSGGCKAPIDDVRCVTNFSSGRYGAQISKHFVELTGHDVILFREKGSEMGYPDFIDDGGTYEWIEYKYYEDYLKVKDLIKEWQPDIIISAAAISDYIPVKQEGKISSDVEELTITLKKSEKVIQSFRELSPNALIVGFKLLVNPSEQDKEDAIKKGLKYADLVVYNDLSELRKGNSARYVYGDPELDPVKVEHVGDLVKYILDFKEEYVYES